MKLILLGDSTMHQNDLTTYPQQGWGEALSVFFDCEIQNYAMNGCSTKSFIDKGYAQQAIDAASFGDWAIIQFGHNDEKDDPLRHTDPFGSYQKNLNSFVDQFRRKGVNVIFCTSIYRRCFVDGVLDETTHGLYPQAMKELAERLGVCCIDLCQLTKDKFTELGEKFTTSYFMNFGPNIYPNYPEGKSDNTHLRWEGAYMVCKMFVDELRRLDSPLADKIKN